MDKDALLHRQLPERDVPFADGTVRIRCLSREETQTLRAMPPDLHARENWALARALVDPPMTEDDVAQWRRAWTEDELQPVVDAVLELSALTAPPTKSRGRDAPANAAA